MRAPVGARQSEVSPVGAVGEEERKRRGGGGWVGHRKGVAIGSGGCDSGDILGEVELISFFLRTEDDWW